LPGHTLYAVAIAFEVDGKRALATGDQYQGDAGLELNYVYPNRFRAGDYVASAALYRRTNPDVILSGHWDPLWVTPGYFDRLDRMGAELEALHRALQPAVPDLGAEGFIARLTPYQAVARPGEPVAFAVEVRNPFPRPAEAVLDVVVPAGWRSSRALTLALPALATGTARFAVTPPTDFAARRAR